MENVKRKRAEFSKYPTSAKIEIIQQLQILFILTFNENFTSANSQSSHRFQSPIHDPFYCFCFEMPAKGGVKSNSNPTKVRKRVEAVESTTALKRAKDGSAFAKCEECNKSIPVGLIDMHSCSLEAKIKMTLETQVVEITESKKKPAERKKTKSTDGNTKPRKLKKAKDPNMPKRPPTAFFIFMEGFRKTYKEANPDNKSVSEVAKKGGEEWKTKTDEEKKPYLDKARELKEEYEKAMEIYNAGNNDVEAGSDNEADKIEAAEDVQPEELKDASDEE